MPVREKEMPQVGANEGTCEQTRVVEPLNQTPVDVDKYRLVVIETTVPTMLGRSLPLVESPISIGRDAVNIVALEDDAVSRHHASLINLGKRWWLEDHGSTNGTFLDGAKIEGRLPIDSGAKIKVGETVFKFIRGEDAETRYFERSYRMTVTDPLTGIYNKRFLEQVAERETARARRHKRDLGLLMLDLDHFKKVNDEYGHQAGDAVLREVARLLARRLRSHDFLARYGGEEFTVILPETDRAGTRVVAESLRKLVEDHVFEFEGRRIPVQVSIGCANYSTALSTEQELLAHADRRLYEAKKAGRNRVK